MTPSLFGFVIESINSIKNTSQKEGHQPHHPTSSVGGHQRDLRSGYCLFYRGPPRGRKPRGLRRQETHSGVGAFPASAPHNCGNNTHVNTHIPSRTTSQCALRLADITGRVRVCGSGLSVPVASVPTANAQSGVTSELIR